MSDDEIAALREGLDIAMASVADLAAGFVTLSLILIEVLRDREDEVSSMELRRALAELQGVQQRLETLRDEWSDE